MDNNGCKNLLLIYSKSIAAIVEILYQIDSHKLITVVDPKTSDTDCRSVQTILTHLLNSGYNYINLILNKFSKALYTKKCAYFENPLDYVYEFDELVSAYNSLFSFLKDN